MIFRGMQQRVIVLLTAVLALFLSGCFQHGNPTVCTCTDGKTIVISCEPGHWCNWNDPEKPKEGICQPMKVGENVDYYPSPQMGDPDNPDGDVGGDPGTPPAEDEPTEEEPTEDDPTPQPSNCGDGVEVPTGSNCMGSVSEGNCFFYDGGIGGIQECVDICPEEYSNPSELSHDNTCQENSPGPEEPGTGGPEEETCNVDTECTEEKHFCNGGNCEICAGDGVCECTENGVFCDDGWFCENNQCKVKDPCDVQPDDESCPDSCYFFNDGQSEPMCVDDCTEQEGDYLEDGNVCVPRKPEDPPRCEEVTPDDDNVCNYDDVCYFCDDGRERRCVEACTDCGPAQQPDGGACVLDCLLSGGENANRCITCSAAASDGVDCISCEDGYDIEDGRCVPEDTVPHGVRLKSYGEFGPCSVECGNGVQTREPECVFDTYCGTHPNDANCYPTTPSCEAAGHADAPEQICTATCPDGLACLDDNTCGDLCKTQGVDCEHGSCVPATGLCTCDVGWTGTDCNIEDKCHGVDCNNGTCKDGTCTCYDSWGGSDCRTDLGCVRDPNTDYDLWYRCPGGGQSKGCNGGYCHCIAPWCGPTCNHHCSGGGVTGYDCVDSSGEQDWRTGECKCVNEDLCG
eukprot:gene692-737_t